MAERLGLSSHYEQILIYQSRELVQLVLFAVIKVIWACPNMRVINVMRLMYELTREDWSKRQSMAIIWRFKVGYISTMMACIIACQIDP